jgi:fluoride exporter
MYFLIVFIGAGIGGACRHGVNLLAARLLGSGAFAYGTMGINIVGSLIMGVAVEYFALRSDTQHWRLFVMTGVLGGFTTFSAFSLDTAVLYERGETLAAFAYVLASVVVSIAALFIGLALFRSAYPGVPST